MARAPQQTQRQAPQPLESPAVRRSRILSDMLEQSRQAPPQIQSGGELAARLLAQGLNQFSANRADRAVQEERDALTAQQRDALTRALGGGASAPSPLGNALAPEPAPMSPQIAPVEGSVLPPAAPPQAPAPQSSIPGPLRAQIQLLIDQGDIAGATELFGQYQQQEAIRSTLPPELQNNPMAAFAATQNPEAFAESLGYQFRPQVVAEGGLQSVVGMDQQVRNPRTREFGRDLIRDTEDGFEVLGTRDLLPTEEAALQNAATSRMVAERPEAVNTAAGGLTTILDSEGNPIRQIEGREDPGRAAAREAAALATTQSQERALSVIGNTRAAVSRAREQLSPLSAGVLSGIIPLNQWRANLAGTIETVQANLSFNELAAMRAASPTGGALGSIAVRELELLGATVASLNQNQSPEEFARSLDVIDGAMARWEDTVRQAQQQGQQGARPARGGPQPGQVEDGYQYIGGDPASPSSWRRVQ